MLFKKHNGKSFNKAENVSEKVERQYQNYNLAFANQINVIESLLLLYNFKSFSPIMLDISFFLY